MKILVISSNLIGDTILSSGVINYFLNKYPRSKFTFVIGPSASQIYEHFPNLEKIHIIKKKKFNIHWLYILKKNFLKKWDIIIDFRSSLIGYILFHKKKYIFKKNKKFHHLEQLSNLFKFDCSNLIIHNNSDEKKLVKNYFDKNYQYIVICPGGNWKPKLWSASNYNLLIKEIIKSKKNIKFLIVGSIEEKKYINDLTSGIDNSNFLDLNGMSLTLTSAYMKKSNLFIGNDSGLMHLSVASKLQTIGLFGPTNDLIYAPKGDNCYVVRTKESYNFLRNNIQDDNKSYMDSIKVEDIMNIIKSKNLL